MNQSHQWESIEWTENWKRTHPLAPLGQFDGGRAELDDARVAVAVGNEELAADGHHGHRRRLAETVVARTWLQFPAEFEQDRRSGRRRRRRRAVGRRRGRQRRQFEHLVRTDVRHPQLAAIVHRKSVRQIKPEPRQRKSSPFVKFCTFYWETILLQFRCWLIRS